uniref:Uncharacterized protein n=1 Tax=Phlebotomus papatasi TaxID=29031 RepID=A0A1B0D315_PHLPP
MSDLIASKLYVLPIGPCDLIRRESHAHAQSLSKGEPMFISRSETFKFVAGETIQLPCEVSNTEMVMGSREVQREKERKWDLLLGVCAMLPEKI